MSDDHDHNTLTRPRLLLMMLIGFLCWSLFIGAAWWFYTEVLP